MKYGSSMKVTIHQKVWQFSEILWHESPHGIFSIHFHRKSTVIGSITWPGLRSDLVTRVYLTFIKYINSRCRCRYYPSLSQSHSLSFSNLLQFIPQNDPKIVKLFFPKLAFFSGSLNILVVGVLQVRVLLDYFSLSTLSPIFFWESISNSIGF